jgi:integrase/recombinase XerD
MTKRNLDLHAPGYQLILQGYSSMVMAIGYKTAEKGSMQRMVQEFLHYLEGQGILNIKKVEALDMVAYYEYLSQRPSQTGGVLSSSSLTEHMCSLELLNEYLLNLGTLTKRITLPKNKNKDKKERSILTNMEVGILYKAVETLRDKAILGLAYGCGMRRTEIESLNMMDVQLSKGMLIVREGKNIKRREIPLSNTVIRDLKDYLINERYKYLKLDNVYRVESFLVNNKGKLMKGDHINDRLKELTAKTGSPEILAKTITLHCLRHSIATHLIDRGASIEFVKNFLGHAEIDTVHIYARKRRMKELIAKQLIK